MQRNEHATATKHENKIHGRDVHKMLNKSLGLRQAWQNLISKTDIRLSDINASLEFETTMPTTEQQNNMKHNLNMASKSMAWSYSTSLTKHPK